MIVAEPGQHIVLSWRLSSAGSWRSGGGSDERLGHGPSGGLVIHRKPGPCSVTIVFVDGGGSRVDQDSDVSGNRNAPTDAPFRDTASGYDVIDSAIHVTTCSVGARDEPRVIYASKTNRLQIRPTDALLANLIADNVDDVNWKPHLLEYRSKSARRRNVFVNKSNRLTGISTEIRLMQ